MKRFFRSKCFVMIWAAAMLLYWPAGVALAAISLLADFDVLLLY